MSILPIFIPHAGCPHQCVFCNQKTISGQKLAAVAGAKEQLARWRSWLRPSVANEAAFYGGSFTGLPLELQEELLALTDALLAEGFIGNRFLHAGKALLGHAHHQLQANLKAEAS